jgi:beta-glucosidase
MPPRTEWRPPRRWGSIRRACSRRSSPTSTGRSRSAWGGNAVADVLFGKVNPGGKLPVTFPHSVGQIPLYYNHENTGRPADPDNKFTSKDLEAPVTPLYEFGFGLSYTTFTVSNLRLSAPSMPANGTIRSANDRSTGGEQATFRVTGR